MAVVGLVLISFGIVSPAWAHVRVHPSTARQLGMDTGVGLHSGEIELRGDAIGGLTVNVAARVTDQAARNDVLVSRTVTDLVAGSVIRFEDRGRT